MPKENESRLLNTVSVYPPDRNRDERIRDYRTHMESGQRLEIDNRGKLRVVQEVGNMRPKQILVLSDWHLGSVAADMDKMDELLAYVLSNPDVMVIFAGDEIEGWSGGKHSQSIDAKTKLDAQQQMEFMRMMYFEPLAKAGRILGMVSEYWAHPGWLAEKTVNAWRTMVGDLDIPLIQNGGELVLRFPNGYEHAVKVWHNPPKGGGVDELAGQRTAMQTTSESARPKGSVAGHIHRLGVAEEVYAGAKHNVYYVSAGTLKGTNLELPTDLYGTQMGLSRPEPQGQGFNVIPRSGRRADMNIPFPSIKHAKVSLEALTQLNKIESLGMKKELLELIHDEKKGVEAAPTITYRPEISRMGHRYTEDQPADAQRSGRETLKNPYSNMEMKVPHSELAYDIETQLPIALQLIANARIGAGTEGLKYLDGYMKKMASNPHSLMLFLRNMIDRDAGKLPNRVDVLDKFVDLINGNSEQTLAIMMCESMRQDAWKSPRDTGDLEEYVNDRRKLKTRRIYTPPIAPASYVATETDKPLVHHLSLLKLAIGPGKGSKTLYSGVVADKLEGHGSGTKPEWGPSRLYDLHIHEKPGFVVGGHLKNAGAMMFYDGSNRETNYPILVAPGYWADAVDSIGKGNVQEGADPGQAIIFMPGRNKNNYLAFPTVSTEETEYMDDALTIMTGLRILGLTDQVMGRKRR